LNKQVSHTPGVNILMTRDADSLFRQAIDNDYDLIISSFVFRKILEVDAQVLHRSLRDWKRVNQPRDSELSRMGLTTGYAVLDISFTVSLHTFLVII
jgi:hypothetical protein